MAVIHTVGHSTRTAEELIELLRAHGVRVLADVRRFPASRRHPWFNREPLAATLRAAGVEYAWFGDSLGGRRGAVLPVEQSPNRAWRVEGFRHYADATSLPEFRRGLAALERLASARPAAVMCAEAAWWRCHRRILADVLLARGWEVRHIRNAGACEPHRLTPTARVDDGWVTYPALL